MDQVYFLSLYNDTEALMMENPYGLQLLASENSNKTAAFKEKRVIEFTLFMHLTIHEFPIGLAKVLKINPLPGFHLNNRA